MFFKDTKKYLFKIRRYIIFSILIYAISIWFGYDFALSSPDEVSVIVKEYSQMFEFIKETTPLNLFIFIFLKNSLTTFLIILAGPILGLFSLLSLFVNGAVLGLFAFVFSEKFSFSLFLAGILPHGAIEIPVFFFATAMGFWLARIAFRRIFFGEKKLKEEFFGALNFFFYTLLPLLLIASFIEAFITPTILAMFR